ncbi:MAG: hypothetical protein MI741_11850 [Rhodospirillales bacterium]|nr:hypothetical protein [Rhodospirillales bacterium]
MISNPATDSWASLPPELREQVEDVAHNFVMALRDDTSGAAVRIPDRISAKAERWIRGHAGEFSAYVIRQYRQFPA